MRRRIGVQEVASSNLAGPTITTLS